MTTSCCSRLQEVNGGGGYFESSSEYTYAELSSSFFLAAKVGSIKGI